MKYLCRRPTSARVKTVAAPKRNFRSIPKQRTSLEVRLVPNKRLMHRNILSGIFNRLRRTLNAAVDLAAQRSEVDRLGQ